MSRNRDTVTRFPSLRLGAESYNGSEDASDEKLFSPLPRKTENAMSRRPVALLAIAIASFVLAACNSATAPQPRGDEPCSGVIGSDGRCHE